MHADRLERLEADVDRAALANWMIAHSYLTGHGDKHADLLGELGAQVDQHRRNYMERIRERDEYKGYLDAIARVLHPHKEPGSGWTYLPKQLAGMVAKQAEELKAGETTIIPVSKVMIGFAALNTTGSGRAWKSLR